MNTCSLLQNGGLFPPRNNDIDKTDVTLTPAEMKGDADNFLTARAHKNENIETLYRCIKGSYNIN